MTSTEPILKTARFDIHKHEIFRSEEMGGVPRSVFHAWFHSGYDVPKPVCVVTVFEMLKFVEWVHVDEEWRRTGIATEVLRAIESLFGELDIIGVTKAGQGFCAAYVSRGIMKTKAVKQATPRKKKAKKKVSR